MKDTVHDPVVETRRRDSENEREMYERLSRSARRFAEEISENLWYIWHHGGGDGSIVMLQVQRALADVGYEVRPGEDYAVESTVDRLAARDGWNCHYCDHPLGWGSPLVARPERDHVMPRSRGGANGVENLVLACSPCNREKAAQTPSEWLGSPCCENHRRAGL